MDKTTEGRTMETANTDGRKERGLEIAARFRVVRKGQGWSVPSQSGAGSYMVTGLPTEVTVEAPRCSCPDHETRMVKCKHIWAVEYVIQRETHADGSTTVTESVTVTKTERRTYAQNWPAYNAAQTTEGDLFPAMLRDLCRGIAEPEQQRRGRPRATLADSVFCATLKVYSTLSTRRFMSDLRAAQDRGLIAKAPHHSSVFRYLEDPAMTQILRDLIVESSKPLSAVEVDFAVDSTGFTTSRFESWFDHRYGVDRPTRQHTWVKAHIACGVKTNVVTAVEIHERNAADVKQLPALVQATARNFAIAEVSADKAYGSVKNATAIESVGGTPFIALRRNITGADIHATSAWSKMHGYFIYRRDEFLTHYHKRSNVETTFSMIKRKFGDFVRSKTDTAMVNEVLAKVLCHNIVVLIHEMHELGIAPAFQAEPAA
jgi:transposase